MFQNEFSYWVQGFFELRNETEQDNQALTEAQWRCVKKHLELVKTVEKKGLSGFPAWLDGVLTVATCPELVVDQKALTRLVETKLGEHFQHVIDKTYPGDQKVLNEIHNPPDPGPGGKFGGHSGREYRC